MPHRKRSEHCASHPVHVTLRAKPGAGRLRVRPVFEALRDAIGAASGAAFRVVHFSVQHDHVHLLIEASNKQELTRGMRGLTIRTARAVNRAAFRCGRVWAERYHARPLASPRQVRNVLVYILRNGRKHESAEVGAFDPCSSAPWFDGFRDRGPIDPPGVARPVARARTWLAGVGWRRLGLIRTDEAPRMVTRRRPPRAPTIASMAPT
jgi:REP element-mobilizing transposase RayT